MLACLPTLMRYCEVELPLSRPGKRAQRARGLPLMANWWRAETGLRTRPVHRVLRPALRVGR